MATKKKFSASKNPFKDIALQLLKQLHTVAVGYNSDAFGLPIADGKALTHMEIAVLDAFERVKKHIPIPSIYSVRYTTGRYIGFFAGSEKFVRDYISAAYPGIETITDELTITKILEEKVLERIRIQHEIELLQERLKNLDLNT